MLTLLKNIDCFCPKHIGVKDILIVKDIIYKILDTNSWIPSNDFVNIIDCDGLIATPGIIDGHVHITGGGGEDGFTSRIKEIDIRNIISAGITSVVGLLGADDETRSLTSLLAKAKALEQQGITTFIYAGSYAVPIKTFTGSIVSDMVLIDKVIGAGEVAIADHRSSHPDLKTMLELSSKTHLGGLISGKAGLVHIHVGDGKGGLSLLRSLIAESDLPIEQFLPTHVNRNKALFEEAIAYAKSGGNIDLTSGEEAGLTVPEAVLRLINKQVGIGRITVSSDANGSIPGGGVGEIQTLFDDMIKCITEKHLDISTILPLFTENVSKRLNQYPKKGVLAEGSDADIMILDNSFRLQKLFSMGKQLIDRGIIIDGNLEEHR